MKYSQIRIHFYLYGYRDTYAFVFRGIRTSVPGHFVQHPPGEGVRCEVSRDTLRSLSIPRRMSNLVQGENQRIIEVHPEVFQVHFPSTRDLGMVLYAVAVHEVYREVLQRFRSKTGGYGNTVVCNIS